jgi:hypothetical protein
MLILEFLTTKKHRPFLQDGVLNTTNYARDYGFVPNARPRVKPVAVP